MGKPSTRYGVLPVTEFIGGVEGTRGSETSQYPQEEKTICDSVSSGERKRMGLNLYRVIPGRGCGAGVVGSPVQGLPFLGDEVQAYRRSGLKAVPERVLVP